jgi:two-component system sensor histidine kinase GlrK
MRPSLWFPPSYAGALLGAFALVLAPLAVALGLGMLQLQRLAERSQASVVRAADLAAQSRSLREALREIERTTRQSEVLGPAAVLDTYDRQRERLTAATAALLKADSEPDWRAGVQAVIAAERSVNALMRGNRAGDAVDALATLQAAVEAFDQQAQELGAAERDALARLPGEASIRLVWVGAAAVPLAIALAAWFAWRLGEPVRRLGAAMRRLGDGDLETPVAVGGPREVALLGDGLEWLRERLRSLESARERFLRGVSHDLKTPIAAIAEGGALLNDELYGKLSAQQRAVVDLIGHNTARLLERVEELLRAAVIAPAVARPSANTVDLGEVVRRVLADHRLALEARTLRVEADLPAVVVAGDPERLRIVIDNLASNAIKVSPPGAAIGIALARDGALARLDVVDQGPGLAPGEEETIFRLGNRGSAAQRLGTRGSGQGLAIAREFAESLGGRVYAQPSDQGAHFVLTVPLAETSHA